MAIIRPFMSAPGIAPQGTLTLDPNSGSIQVSDGTGSWNDLGGSNNVVKLNGEVIVELPGKEPISLRELFERVEALERVYMEEKLLGKTEQPGIIGPMSDDKFIEVLEKKCPRCGAATHGKAERCAKHKKQLRDNKKKPGHWQRAQTKADDALRRQKGKNGTASKKHSGLGSRKSIVKQTQSAEKKTGEKLSPDRKNNSKGYAASNTRLVPEKLNRGRHHVDEKKLRNWRKKLKKHDIGVEEFYTLMKAKAVDSEFLTDLLKNMTAEGLEQYMTIFDQEE